MKTWEFRCPILPDIRDFENNDIKKYLSPDGNFYMGVWELEDKHHNIYSDKVISFRKEEIQNAHNIKRC